MLFDEHGTRSAGAFHTSVFVVLVIACGTVLHPELKAFYRRGHGDMKNTVSALDTALATLFLAALRLCSRCASDAPRPSIPFWQKLRWAAPPGIFVFLVITLYVGQLPELQSLCHAGPVRTDLRLDLLPLLAGGEANSSL